MYCFIVNWLWNFEVMNLSFELLLTDNIVVHLFTWQIHGELSVDLWTNSAVDSCGYI